MVRLAGSSLGADGDDIVSANQAEEKLAEVIVRSWVLVLVISICAPRAA
jgi:hypothetical protein